jgi:N-acetylmuramoyl-L-alanine amidase
VVLNLDRPVQPVAGLAGRHIALWPSHGWYYEHSLGRWEWQRARVFQTVEDLLPMSFVVPYLAPMLEQAGARVFMPRERDVQTHEVVVDNDTQVTNNAYVEQSRGADGAWQAGGTAGFAVGRPPYEARENPFRQGTYRLAATSPTPTASVRWVPEIPTDGDYAVYISYAAHPQAASDARYTVYHKGGTTAFAVNQRMGGGTWIYLGTFSFAAGLQEEQGQVVLTNQSAEAGRVVTADAVRFGGGMGNVSRNGQVSGRPRFVEGARYYMQYAGMPDSLVYNVSDPEDDDYRDDYQGRGEWVNYLVGAPFGPNKDRSAPGLGIPIDLSLAFHTDAGFTRNDTTVGTLMIYNSEGADGTTDFPDGMSRFANRDFGDVLQSQLVDDLRAAYDPAWNRRSIWDRPYSEAHRPNVPSALLELLSHHNFLDMKFALDPRFRFDASRAIYKAILRFVATQHQVPYTVQPLPVTHMAATFTGPGTVTLQWRPQSDPLEPSAEAMQ